MKWSEIIAFSAITILFLAPCKMVFSQDFQAMEDSLVVLEFFPEYTYEHVPDASYFEIEERLAAISSTIPLHFNERVKSFVDYFSVRNRDYTRMVMARSHYYFPIFEKYLAEYKLPDELKYLAIIESGLAVKARSRVSAVGLWQFMYATGRMYGLRIDGYLDERMDPEKSTETACKHLSMLYREFGDWELALAAYNCGSGNVRKAMRRSGGKRAFWDIYPYLPRETRSYLPQFVAILYVFNYAEEHNFFLEPMELLYPIAYDTVHITGTLDLPALAGILEICPEDLEFLNPALRHGVLPESNSTMVIRIPSETTVAFEARRTEILDTLAVVGKAKAQSIARQASGSIAGRDRIVHVVRSGDVLGKIAQMYRVRLSDLHEWNNINGNLIRVGQRLIVYPHPEAGYSAKNSQPQPPAITVVNGTRYHIVQPGDSLWSISRAYQDLTVEKLKKLNNLNSDKLQPGQKLVIG